MSADLIGDDACREAFNKARQQRFSVHGLDVVCEPDIFRAGYAAGRDSEIAKRDARMAELEKELQAGATAVENCELFRAELAAIKAQEPDCDRSACGDFSPGPCDNPDCSARRDRTVVAPAAKAQGEYGDAYQGAREDLAIWKRRALEAEKALQEERIITERLGNALNEENGPTFMGEPVFPAKAQGVVMQSTDGGRNPRYEGLFDGETEEQRASRLNATPVQQVSVPDGYAIVPIVPTPEMIKAALDKPCFDPLGELLPWSHITRASYAAMLAAAPAAPAADAGLVEALEMALEIGDGCSRGFLGKFQAKARAAIAAHRAK